jgi:hypothetical protein
VFPDPLSKVCARPAKPLGGAGGWLVLAADPARVALPVEEIEQERVVDLPRAGLVAVGIVGELNMGDPAFGPQEGSGEFALRALLVVEIALLPAKRCR